MTDTRRNVAEGLDHSVCEARAQYDAARIRELTAMRDNDPWLWEEDGDNDLAGLSSDCPILIMPRTLERLLRSEGREDAPEPRPGKEGASAFVQECQRKVSHGEDLTLLEAGGLIQLAFGNPHVYPVGATLPQQARDMRDRLKAGQVDDVLTWLNQIAAAAGDPPDTFRAE